MPEITPQQQKSFDYTSYSIPATGSSGRTGSWRSRRPVIIIGKCTKCNLCWLYCPEGTITKSKSANEFPDVDLVYCKGCGICAAECPTKSIVMEDEKEF